MAGGGSRVFGNRGEDLAAAYLESSGYRILERNYRTREGEIDIVAEKDGVTVFVEVKSRRSGRFGTPEESVTPAKVKKIRLAAAHYLSQGPPVGEVRFDLIAVHAEGAGEPRLNHLPAAF